MTEFKLKKIGSINSEGQGFEIRLLTEYKEGLTNINGFSWLNIYWWANQLDSDEYRNILVTDKPYKEGPDKLGIFGTRSPLRPNPICVTPVFVSRIDHEAGIIYTPYIDTEGDTPLIDIKPYHGSTDRIDSWQVPDWCSSWPKNLEESADFAWDEVFNF